MLVRGIRGAITVKEDDPSQVLLATRELLEEITKQNDLNSQDIASILFTVTPDIKSVFPAQAARSIGLEQVPLLCTQEIAVVDALPLCIRVLLHVNTDKSQEEINHVFLRDAVQLRKDLIKD
ncbi:MAG: chorismate mutase [Syntrophomonas sp.]